MQEKVESRKTAMNILVTGGAGYIGSSLVPLLLADGHRVRVLDSLLHGGDSLLGVWSHPCFEFIRGDVSDRAKLQAGRCRNGRGGSSCRHCRRSCVLPPAGPGARRQS